MDTGQVLNWLLESLLGHVIAGCLVLDRNLAAQYSL